MALIIPPGFLHAVYELDLDGDPEQMVVTMGHEIDGASGANADDAADDLFGFFDTNIVPQLDSDYTFAGVTAYIGQDGTVPLVKTSTTAPSQGTNTYNAAPQNTAYLVRKRTDLAGRRGRGRLYLPGVDEGQVGSNGVIVSTHVTSVQNRLDAWYDDLTGAVGARLYPPVVLHRSEGIGAEPLPTPITTLVLDNVVATQRRRLRR